VSILFLSAAFKQILISVVENWQRLQEIASLVTEFPLEDDGESALSFEP